MRGMSEVSTCFSSSAGVPQTLAEVDARSAGNWGRLPSTPILLRSLERRRVLGDAWHIYVKQDGRGRDGSGGVLDMNTMQEEDGSERLVAEVNRAGERP